MAPIIAAALISGVAGLASSLFGGSKEGKERRKMAQYLQQREADNKSWYNANALADYTNRSDVQNLIRVLRENLSKQNKATANSAVVTGATPEAQAVAKEQSNKVIADTYANIGAIGQQYKDRITDRYLAQKNYFDKMQFGMSEASATSYGNLMNNGLNIMAGSLGDIIRNWPSNTQAVNTGSNTPAANATSTGQNGLTY